MWLRTYVPKKQCSPTLGLYINELRILCTALIVVRALNPNNICLCRPRRSLQMGRKVMQISPISKEEYSKENFN